MMVVWHVMQCLLSWIHKLFVHGSLVHFQVLCLFQVLCFRCMNSIHFQVLCLFGSFPQVAINNWTPYFKPSLWNLDLHFDAGKKWTKHLPQMVVKNGGLLSGPCDFEDSRVLKLSSFRIGKYIIPGDHYRSPKDSQSSYGLESVQKSPTQQIPGDLPSFGGLKRWKNWEQSILQSLL